MRSWSRRFLIVFSVAVIATAWLWTYRQVAPRQPEHGREAVPIPPKPHPVEAAEPQRPRVFVLAINGGGFPVENYQSHLLHLQGLVDLLHQAGVPGERITVLAGDGSDPNPDLLVKEESISAEYWRLQGTALEGRFPRPAVLGNSEVSGATLYPATRGSLTIWLLTVGQQLRSDDTLLLYVTDHGTMGADSEDNRIVLWGPERGLSVRELREALETLEGAPRVVALMSQCFSGAFASLLNLGSAQAEPTGRFCGFFSARSDGKAYGCYPETRDKAKVGHSFAFLQALPAAAGRFALAHELVVERDDTPDMPLRTSDVYLSRVLEKAASASSIPAQQLTDNLLLKAWARPKTFDHQAQRIDRLAERFGLPSVRSQADVDEARRRLREWLSRIDNTAKKLAGPLDDLNDSVFQHFLGARPDWQTLLKPAALKATEPPLRMRLGVKLVSELATFAGNDGEGQTQAAAKELVDANRQLTFRTTVRLAALDRMALMLDSVAGLQYLDGKPAERDAAQTLLACEDLVLPVPAGTWPAPAPLPPPEDDWAQADMMYELAFAESALRPGEPAPRLRLVPYRGGAPTAGNGKPLLLFFWATWCKACKAAIPALLALAEERNLTILAITPESEADLNRFFAAPRDFPWLVSRDPDGRAMSRLGLHFLPSFLLLDGQGKVASPVTSSLRDLPIAIAQ